MVLTIKNVISPKTLMFTYFIDLATVIISFRKLLKGLFRSFNTGTIGTFVKINTSAVSVG
jgi:hypothetical protein